ncbi:hypothetical protein [Vibrio cincinnatiensis]|uniref:hypothetical protein n=1 Tax=Vibrio cincinnatiensis TaxID=675 RepID=UPI001EDF95E3|nr:hypothetical protein [Vibrio cincinnatiensis]EKO3587249.1 hypothetical protein [Vibrio metschnikovii]EKO3733201.1 hypothetical protein [Vibrio metschnikovii]MCG3733758.1 hypothetical protein [Vibrio cincinnatiensis]MCG3740931.1 hypothetical protein [Vibrio cincinnatiensis]
MTGSPRTFYKLTTLSEKEAYLAQVWDILQASYQQVPGGLHYSKPQDALNKTDEWHLIVENDQVLALTLHKYKHGVKLVALAKSRLAGSRRALKQLIEYALLHGWMELSDQAESFVMRECQGHRFLIHASFAPLLLKKTILPAEGDSFHYRRRIMQSVKTKLLLGSPNFSQLRLA